MVLAINFWQPGLPGSRDNDRKPGILAGLLFVRRRDDLEAGPVLVNHPAQLFQLGNFDLAQPGRFNQAVEKPWPGGNRVALDPVKPFEGRKVLLCRL